MSKIAMTLLLAVAAAAAVPTAVQAVPNCHALSNTGIEGDPFDDVDDSLSDLCWEAYLTVNEAVQPVYQEINEVHQTVSCVEESENPEECIE